MNKLSATDASFAFSCQYCKIESIAAEAFADIPNIFRVDLSRNDLTSAALRSDVFRGRPNEDQFNSLSLTELDLSQNKIEQINRDLFQYLVRLRRLSLAFNALNTLSEDTIAAIGGLSTLKQLDLSSTNIDTLPDEMLKNMQLNELYVQGNRLKTIPESISLQRSSLEFLNIGGNLCAQFNDESFLGLSMLKQLTAGYMMELEDISSGSFHSLVSLEILDLSHSPKLKNLNLGGLVASTNLKKVNIWWLKSVKFVFTVMFLPMQLDLTNCSLSTLNLELPGNTTTTTQTNSTTVDVRFPKLRTIMMKDNPWHCDCSLYKSLYKLMNLDKNMFFSQYNAR